MSALFYLIPMTLLILGGAFALFAWSLKRGHYEDMDSPAHRILIDDREERARLDAQAEARSKTPDAAASAADDKTGTPPRDA